MNHHEMNLWLFVFWMFKGNDSTGYCSNNNRYGTYTDKTALLIDTSNIFTEYEYSIVITVTVIMIHLLQYGCMEK